MTIRLNKVTRDLNVGISTVVEFLQKKGFAVEANPNTKINEEQYALLVKEFSTDKNLRLESERFIQERQNKDRNKASVSIDGYEAETTEKPKVEEIKTVVPEDARPKFKPVGKIDLDKLNRKPVVEKVEEKKVETSAPVVKEEPKPQPKPEPKPEPAPSPDEPASMKASRTSLAELEGKLPGLPAETQASVRAIMQSANNILGCMATDPRDVDHGARFLKRYLAATHGIVDTHLRFAHDKDISPDVASALARSNDMLARLKVAFAKEHALLLQNDVTDFSADLKTLDTLLKMDGN